VSYHRPSPSYVYEADKMWELILTGVRLYNAFSYTPYLERRMYLFMEIENLFTVISREGLRAWLQENGKTEKSCWVVVSMTPNPDTLLYLDAVEQSLCFGWIDGVKKKISETDLAQRLSPRSKKRSWTDFNKERD